MKQILTTITIITTFFFSTLLACPVYAEQPKPENANSAPPLILPKGDFSTMHKTGVSKVVEVINPMTIKLDDGRMIALTGLDYPDLDFYDPGELAVTAQRILEDFLTGKKVIIYQTPKSDSGRMNRMGHHIAHIVCLDENNSSEEDSAVWAQGLMLSLGLARVRTTKYNRLMAEQMLKIESETRDNKIGLWGIHNYSVLAPEEATKHIGSFQIIEGTVKSISKHKNNLYINFGGNWRDDFTIGIGGANMHGFTNDKVYPDQWNGAKVRVRGWVESYNGPFIELDHPERLEILFTKASEATQRTAPQADPVDTPITFEGNSLPSYN
jgi:hypothetical protein